MWRLVACTPAPIVAGSCGRAEIVPPISATMDDPITAVCLAADPVLKVPHEGHGGTPWQSASGPCTKTAITLGVAALCFTVPFIRYFANTVTVDLHSFHIAASTNVVARPNSMLGTWASVKEVPRSATINVIRRSPTYEVAEAQEWGPMITDRRPADQLLRGALPFATVWFVLGSSLTLLLAGWKYLRHSQDVSIEQESQHDWSLLATTVRLVLVFGRIEYRLAQLCFKRSTKGEPHGARFFNTPSTPPPPLLILPHPKIRVFP